MTNTSFKTTVEWNAIPWHKLERKVFKLQKRIYRASGRGDVKTVRKLQKTWAKRRHPRKSKEWIETKYWQTQGNDNWVFVPRGDANQRLYRHTYTKIKRYVKVRGEASPFDGNWVYWSSRIGNHPEKPMRITKLLKQQKGKCAHCNLYFSDNDLMEVDHKIPKSQGGKDEYSNFQILHRHCHDKKTNHDLKGAYDRSHTTEEPDEVKVSRPVLKTS